MNYLSVNKTFLNLKNVVRYEDMVDVMKIKKLLYYDRFTNIKSDDIVIFPKGIQQITFGNYFNRYIKGTIPSSVTHLTFGFDFNKDIKGALPSSITHLIFGFFFNRDIRGAIPSSVTHLIFGDYFDKDIKGAIPSSVTHLTIGYDFDQDVDVIPPSITCLTIYNPTYEKRKDDYDKLKCKLCLSYY